MTYFGDIGPNSRVMLDYFERNGARHCNEEENPAEYLYCVLIEPFAPSLKFLGTFLKQLVQV